MSDEGRAPSGEGELRTFLIADVRGYTLFTQRRGDAAAAALATRFADVTQEVVQVYAGSVIELRGDEALCAFTSTRRAILAALALQERFIDETAADPENAMPVGIGLDAGEAVAVGEGYRGAALNLAARLCAQAGAGEILATAGVVHLAGKVDGVRYVDRGTVRLKNVPDPVGLIKVMPEIGDPAERLRQHWQPQAVPPVRKPRPRLGLIAAAVAIVLVAASLPFLLDGSKGGTVEAGSIGILDTSGRLTGQVHVGDSPTAIGSGAGAVWVSDAVGGTVARLDPASGTVLQRIQLGSGPSGVAVAGGDVWVTNADARTVSRIDPGSEPGQEHVVATIAVGNGPLGIAAADGRLWVANSVDATVSEIDASAEKVVVRTHAVGALPADVASGGGRVWVSERGADAVAELDPATGDVVREIAVGRAPGGIAWGLDAVWVSNADDGTVSRIDPASGSVTATIEVGNDPGAIAVVDGAVWVAVAGEGAVVRLDSSGTVTDAVPLTNAPEALAAVGDAVWVAVQSSLASHRGGTLVVGASDGPTSLDPATIFDRFAFDQLGPILASTNDGLVGLRRAGGIGGSTLVPDLAAALPVPSDDGTTYTFVLRIGPRFSTGEPVTPGDVRATFERLLSRDLSDDAFLREALVINGAEACTSGSCDLSGGIETDDATRTVSFHLSRPDPDFLRHLALPSFVILPEGTPVEMGTEAPAATGPYEVTRFVPGTAVILERNPSFLEWSSDAQPAGFPDRIEFRFGMGPDEQVDAVIGGDLDIMYFDRPPPERLAQLETEYPQQLRPFAIPATTLGMFLNVRVPPFDDRRARRAAAFALDREALAEAMGADRPGSAPIVTCTIIGPGLPGSEPHCPFTEDPDALGTWSAPNLAEARRLVRASGTRGMAITVWGLATTASVSEEAARALSLLGYRTSVNLVPEEEYGAAVTDPSTRAQMGIVGLDANTGSPSELIDEAFSCRGPWTDPSIHRIFGFCDRLIDEAIDRALTLQETDQYAANRAWVALDHRLVDLAPIIPFAIPAAPLLVSERVGNVQHNPLGGVLLDQIWIR